MCFGGSKQPAAPVKTPDYSADQIDQNIDVTQEQTSEVKRQDPYQFEEEDDL
jgi:hypothetical protein